MEPLIREERPTVTAREDAGATSICQTLCDYDGCRVICNSGTPHVVPDGDPYD